MSVVRFFDELQAGKARVVVAGSLGPTPSQNEVRPISVFALNLVTGAGLGLAIDYSLLLLSRYREELVRQGPGLGALRAAGHEVHVLTPSARRR